MRIRVRHALRSLTAVAGLLALTGTALRASDTTVQASPEEIAAEKAKQAKIEKSLAADPKNLDLRIQLGRVLCDFGAFGDEKASNAAVELLKALHKEQPKDAEILSFYGNACTIYAQYSSIFTKLSWANDGFDYMDEAVKDSPDDINVHLTRAINSTFVPGFLGREKCARNDFNWLIKRIAAAPKDFSPDLLRTIYYFDGKFQFEHDDPSAIQLLTQAAAIPPTPESTLGPKINDLLKLARAKFQPAAPIAKAS